MFQYAAALSLSPINPAVILPPPQENQHSPRDYRAALFHRLKHSTSVPSYPRAILDAFDPWEPSTIMPSQAIVIQGYFQYLPAIRPILPVLCRDILESLSQRQQQLREKYKLRALHTVGFIHVRRGDYLTAKGHTHWVQNPTFYEEAITKSPPVKRWLVISDDIAWCKQEPVFQSFELVDEPDELDGLALMSLCHGAAIIANSTYSWWGAILSEAPTAYPSKWLDDARPDLFPQNWIRI